VPKLYGKHGSINLSFLAAIGMEMKTLIKWMEHVHRRLAWCHD